MPFARYTQRNSRPAHGQDILSLSQLRHYLRKFWREREYGVCHIRGGRAAFLRWCGERAVQDQIKDRLLRAEPTSEYLSRPLQRLLSRKVLMVLRGEVVFLETPDGVTWKPLLGAPEPPVPGEILPPDHHFRIEHTVLGPRIRRF